MVFAAPQIQRFEPISALSLGFLEKSLAGQLLQSRVTLLPHLGNPRPKLPFRHFEITAATLSAKTNITY